MGNEDKMIDFSKTDFYKGAYADFGKVPVAFELGLRILQPETKLIMSLYAGCDKLHQVKDIEYFLECFRQQKPYRFGKNFIFEPDKMYVEKPYIGLLECLCDLRMRRMSYQSQENSSPQHSEILFAEMETEQLLDAIWEDIGQMKFDKSSRNILFETDIKLKIKVEKSSSSNRMLVDYSAYGDFLPLTINFRYIYVPNRNLVIKLSKGKQEFVKNLYPFKNDEHLVSFVIPTEELRFFQRNFLDKYTDILEISMNEKTKKELEAERLLTKVYIDIAAKGIISKMEFCYADKVINPLDDGGGDKNFREIDLEQKAEDCLKSYGFREYKNLYLLDDVEQIMFLLTDKLADLKKLSEVYYSVDFKKLYVKDIDSASFSLSEDESVIHMNINLENITDEELLEMLDAIKAGKKYYRLKNGSIVNLSSVKSSKLIDLIASLDIDNDKINNGMFTIPASRSMYIDTYLKEKGVSDVTMDERLGCLLKKVSEPELMEDTVPDCLKDVLRSYQQTGVKWLRAMAGYSFGGILADDMGLGKTLQVLAFIACEKQSHKKEHLPCLVVAPASVIYNWEIEAEKFTPDLKVLVITGQKEKRNLMISLCKEYDLAVTSYGALKNDGKAYQEIKFQYIFLDEAQNIKNPETLNAQSVKSIDAKCAFALTGTPIENRLSELWSIFDFIMPGLLSDHTHFMRNYEEPIIKQGDTAKMDELSNIIKPFMIRRMKRDVLTELPDKIESNYFVEMKEEQKKLYAAYYKEFKNELMPKIDAFGMAKNQIELFSALTRLRQICAHPGTFLDTYEGESGKLDFAMELIRKSMASGHSILLFSQFTKMLKIIRKHLEKEALNYYYLDGAMNPYERRIEIDNFNADAASVFLISLKAGGTGLNLTKADIVIHFDPWWNPATEDQASDRVYRIGQKNVVHVFNLLTEGTIEEMIARLKEKKRGLLENFIKPGETFLHQLNEKEIRELFS